MTQATSTSWNRLRKIIKKRDNSICFYCGKRVDNGQCDHLIPLSRGGTDSILNLVWSCGSCNGKKSNKLVQALMSTFNNVPVEEKTNEPRFDKIIPDLIYKVTMKFIPPYARYSKEIDWTAYFNYIEFLTVHYPLRTWLRNRIWIMPPEVQAIMESLDTLNYLKLQASKNLENTDLLNCPLCDSSVKLDYFTGYSFKWVCDNGHNGTGTNIHGEGFIEEMRLCAIKQAGEKVLGKG